MSWIELQWVVPRRAIELLSAQLFELGALGVQEDFIAGEAPPPRQPWDTGPEEPLPPFMLLKGWWEEEGIAQTKDAISRLAQEHPETREISWVGVSPQNWESSWKDHFSRKVFSDKLAIAPPWEAQEGDVILEPGIAFGTGEHPTTASCLEAISAWAEEGLTCLDVGCGSGILALAATKLGLRSVGIDIEEQAIVSANENAEKNNLQIDFSQTDIANIVSQFDIVVANLYAEVLVALSPDIIRCVTPGGKLALAGILTSKQSLVLEAFSSLRLLRTKEEGDWTALWLEK